MSQTNYKSDRVLRQGFVPNVDPRSNIRPAKRRTQRRRERKVKRDEERAKNLQSACDCYNTRGCIRAIPDRDCCLGDDTKMIVVSDFVRLDDPDERVAFTIHDNTVVIQEFFVGIESKKIELTVDEFVCRYRDNVSYRNGRNCLDLEFYDALWHKIVFEKIMDALDKSSSRFSPSARAVIESYKIADARRFAQYRQEFKDLAKRL